MLNISFITDLHRAFPNAHISDPHQNASYVFDGNGAMMGHFDFNSPTFYLNKDYQFFKEAKYKLNECNIEYAEKEYSEAELMYK